MPTKTYIYLGWGGATRRFLSLNFNNKPSEDGSLYLALDRTPKARWDETTQSFRAPDRDLGERPLDRFRVSYHTTGRINFHGMGGTGPTTIFGEPISELSNSLHLALLSFPRADSLEALSSSPPDDAAVFQAYQPADSRLSIGLIILPDNDQARADFLGPWVEVRFPGLLRVLAIIVPNPSPVLPEHAGAVWKWTSAKGPEQGQKMDKNAALIAFHQKASGRQGDLICYWLPATSEYRLIFAVPMRDAPRVKIEFADASLQAEPSAKMLDPERHTKTSEYWFKVRGKGGFVRDPATITRIELDAEL